MTKCDRMQLLNLYNFLIINKNILFLQTMLINQNAIIILKANVFVNFKLKNLFRTR